jgi:L-ribulose-5-phosphate 3-epimerase
MDSIPIGMNGRFFQSNWRPALQEIGFAAENGFRCIQFPAREHGLSEADLGASYYDVSFSLRMGQVTAVMEIVVHVNANGFTPSAKTPLDILKANLPAIKALSCECVHWHLVPQDVMSEADNARLERSLLPQFAEGVAIGKQYGFKFGFEHNEPDRLLFASPESCAKTLKTVPNLYLVWDVNHTIPQHVSDFVTLIPRMSMIHVSDTPLPEVNYHLPIGMGTIDFVNYFVWLVGRGFKGPAILEIGGLPKSGGYGRDTDAALIDSLRKLEAILEY